MQPCSWAKNKNLGAGRAACPTPLPTASQLITQCTCCMPLAHARAHGRQAAHACAAAPLLGGMRRWPSDAHEARKNERRGCGAKRNERSGCGAKSWRAPPPLCSRAPAAAHQAAKTIPTAPAAAASTAVTAAAAAVRAQLRACRSVSLLTPLQLPLAPTATPAQLHAHAQLAAAPHCGCPCHRRCSCRLCTPTPQLYARDSLT